MIKWIKRQFYHQCYIDSLYKKEMGMERMELSIRFFKYKRWVNRK